MVSAGIGLPRSVVKRAAGKTERPHGTRAIGPASGCVAGRRYTRVVLHDGSPNKLEVRLVRRCPLRADGQMVGKPQSARSVGSSKTRDPKGLHTLASNHPPETADTAVHSSITPRRSRTWHARSLR